MVRRNRLMSPAASGLILFVGATYAAPLASKQTPRAAARPTALIGLLHPQSIWVIGAYDKKRGWQNDRSAYALFKQGMRFAVYKGRDSAGTVTIGKVRDGDVLGGHVAPTRERVKTTPAVALLGASRPVVNRPRVQSLVNPIYQKAAAEPLRHGGLTVSRARLTQHLRVDLNGDGEEEVLLCAHSRSGIGSDLSAVRNDYSLAALRFVSEEKVKTVPLAIESHRRDRAEGTVAMSRHEILGCLDINGDGRMEVVLYSKQFERDEVQIFTFDGRTPRRVLRAGWGV